MKQRNRKNRVDWRVRVVTATAALAALAIGGEPKAAPQWDASGLIAAESRIFPESPQFAAQNDANVSPSISLRTEFVYEWNDGRDRLTAIPFVRLDAHDDNRNHGDMRAANWLHIGEDWDLVIGIDKVFWGVTESRHLVDIINQDDGVEDIDGEDKLGQPMVNLRLLGEWGQLSVFVLPGFRERTFPANDARLRGATPIAEDDATFDSGAKDLHTDFALRWAHAVGAWDIGLAHFRGTSREPRFFVRAGAAGSAQLIPHYDQIAQSGVDVQFTEGAWLWKLEAITRRGHGDRFAAMVGGFEFTSFGVLETGVDLGLLAEYLYDGREEDVAPPTPLDDDIFLGARLALNDVQDTSALLGTIFDRHSGATIGFIEAERRIGNSWRIEFESRLFFEVPGDDPLAGIRRDSFISLRLSHFF